MKAKHPFRSIKQQYKRATNLDHHLRKSRRKKERLRNKIEDKERKDKMSREELKK